MLGNIGVPELVIIGVIALLVFGPGRLPELGKSLGRGISEFKAAMSGDTTPARPKRSSGAPTPKA